MADFSSITGLIITSETSVTPDDSRNVKHLEGGQINGRNAYFDTVYDIDVIAKGSVTVKQALETFYDANTNDMNTITIDDSSYSVMFTNKPAVTSKDGAIRWLSFNLTGFEITGDVSSYPNGVEGVGGIGSVINITENIISVNGFEIIGDVGSVTFVGESNLTLSGVAGTAIVDDVTVSGIANIAPAYYPNMMDFDGSTGYYTATATRSGNKRTVVGRFKV